jgi:3-phosphoshikimate 1-carboxyvinyltransferase
MIREITPATRPVSGHFVVPGSKSITNRALLCAALARGTATIVQPADADDTRLMINGLNQLGILCRPDGEGLRVEGQGGRLFAPRYPIPVGNAGTTFRFLLAASSLAEGTTRFSIDPRMAERPIDELVEALGCIGAEVRKEPGEGGIAVTGGRLHGGEVGIDTSRTSQVLSALLLIAPCLPHPFSIHELGKTVSRPYVDMTCSVMKAFGVDPGNREGGSFRFSGVQKYVPASYVVEADASSASYLFAAAAITGGNAEVGGISRRSLQGDAAFVDVLGQMGCQVRETAGGIAVSREGSLRGIDVDMNAMPDMVPTLAVTAMFAAGPTRIRNVAHLRHKESDRLAALAQELPAAGVRVEVHDDGLTVHPGPLRGARLDTHEDHRLAMSFALIGLAVPGISIENPVVVKKSFPGFWKTFEQLEG